MLLTLNLREKKRAAIIISAAAVIALAIIASAIFIFMEKPSKKPSAPATSSVETEPAKKDKAPTKPAFTTTVSTVTVPAEEPIQIEVKQQVKPKGKYSLHVSSFKNDINAGNEVDRISSIGFDAYSERTDLNEKGIWYRIKIGPFETRNEAQSELNRLKQNGIEGRIIINE